jgi:hypothetical protein
MFSPIHSWPVVESWPTMSDRPVPVKSPTTNCQPGAVATVPHCWKLNAVPVFWPTHNVPLAG